MNYEVEMVLNHQSGITHKPKSQTGIESFPSNYWLTHWHCIQVKRLRDGVMIYKAFTKTDKGEVLFIKILKDKCILITSTGNYDIDDVVVLDVS